MTPEEFQKKLQELKEELEKKSPEEKKEIAKKVMQSGGTLSKELAASVPSSMVTEELLKIMVVGNPNGGVWKVQVRADKPGGITTLHFQANLAANPLGTPYNVCHVKCTGDTPALVSSLISSGTGDESLVRDSMAGTDTKYLVVYPVSGVEDASSDKVALGIGQPALMTVTVPKKFFTVAQDTSNAMKTPSYYDEDEPDSGNDDEEIF